jgi:hypothetical protein
MANKIKYNSGIDANALNIGSWSVGSKLGMGPTASTEFKNGLEIPEGGYVIYHNANIRGIVVSNDEELIDVINKLGGSFQYGDIGGALTWSHSNNILVFNSFFENIVTNGLVLNVEPKHISSFADNKPTTNVVTNTNLDTGWSKGYQREIVFNEIAPPTGVDSPTVGFNRGQGSAYWYSYGDYTPQVPGATYTVSLYVKTNDPNFRINFYTANNQETGRFWSSHIAVPNDGHWHRVVWPSFVNPTNSQSDSLSFNMQMSGEYGNATQNRTWLCAPQMEQGTVATPYVTGTRSQNNLIDLSGKSLDGIILGNPTQDTDSNIVLDGAGDHIQFNSHPAFNVDSRTIEVTFKMNSSYANFSPLAVYANGSSSTNRMWLGIQNGKFQMHGWGTDDPTGTTTINVGEWYTCVFSYDKASQAMKVYTNGKLEKSQTNTQGGITATSGMNWYVGAVPGSWQGVTYSDMTLASFKVYDRILSDGEVAQNYYQTPITTTGLVLAIDPSNLVSYESGSTNVYSLVNNITGNLINGVTHDSKTFTFDGLDDHIRFNEDVLDTNGEYTLSAWLRPNGSSWGHNAMALYNTYPGNGNSGMWHHFGEDNVLRWRHGGSTYTVGDLTGIGLVANEWQLTTITWDRTTLKLYKNGKLMNSTTAASDFSKSVSGQARIGMLNYRRTSDDYNWNGDVSIHQVYNTALSQEEILQNYNATAARFK